jgi:hypothetical protein
MVLACLLAPSPWPDGGRAWSWWDLVVPAAIGLGIGAGYFATGSLDLQVLGALLAAVCVRRPIRFGLTVAALMIAHGVYVASKIEVLYQTRNFFGVLTVTNESDLHVHRLIHGTTEHGMQHLHEERKIRRLPRLYYDPTGPIGQYFMTNRTGSYPPVAVVGLGAGALASFAEAGQEVAFYEIDPAVIDVARNPGYFTYLSESRGDVRIVPGDARLTLAREPDGHFGLIVVDAFNSDAVPVHLLTAEALDGYLAKLAPDGVIAFHVSNNYLALDRVLDGHCRAKGLAGIERKDYWDDFTKDELRRGKKPSHWVLLSRSAAAFDRLAGLKGWKPLPGRDDAPVWTDDFSNVVRVLRAPGK